MTPETAELLAGLEAKGREGNGYAALYALRLRLAPDPDEEADRMRDEVARLGDYCREMIDTLRRYLVGDQS